MKTYIKLSLLAVSALGFVSCADLPSSGGSSSASYSHSGGVAKYRAYDRPASLPSNPSEVKVKVSTSKQMVYVMEGSKPLLVMPVNVGKTATPTPAGNFRVYYKDADRRAQTHGYATTPDGKIVSWSKKKAAPAGSRKIGTPMPYWTEFKSGYGFHTGWLHDAPNTHGCIRMHENLSPKFFRLVKNGTPVNISHSQPEDATLGRGVARPVNSKPFPDYPIGLRMSDKIYTYHKKPTFN